MITVNLKIGPSYKVTAKMPGGDCQCFTKSERFDDWSLMEQMAMDAQAEPEKDFVLSPVQLIFILFLTALAISGCSTSL